MLCKNCNKRPATIHLTEISHNNVKQEIHLCEECAQQKGLPYKLQFSLSEVLSSLIEPILTKMGKESPDMKCPNCGIDYATFQKKARFGCAKDYEVFKKGITPILEKIHGATQHYGKFPQGASGSGILKEKELLDLQRELEKLVKSEEFEKAAEIRDKIKKLRTKKKAE
jgi:protein arginine kinase activator